MSRHNDRSALGECIQVALDPLQLLIINVIGVPRMRLYGIDHEEVYPLVVKGVGCLSEMLLIHLHPRIITSAIAIVVIPIVITDGVVDRDSGRLCDWLGDVYKRQDEGYR